MVDLNLKRGPEMRSPRMSNEQRVVDSMDDEAVESLPSRRTSRPSLGPWMLVVTIIVILLIAGFVFKDKIFGAKGIAQGNYQAVFLTNGQVYFGKMTDAQSRYVQLTDIYYLQVTPVLQTGTADEVSGQPTQQQQQQLSLVKLGNELHGPVDEMFINREHVLFIEDLKEDGRVVQAIKDYEEGQQ